jgi:hypothetical protein
MNEVIAAAVEDHMKINANPRRWSELQVSRNRITLTIGVIHSDGTREAAVITRSYYPIGDSVTYTTIVHS